MYCLFFLFASFFLCEVSAEVTPIEKIIKDYFKSDSVLRFRKAWEGYRKPIEHAILIALTETVGVPGMNVYIDKKKEKLALGYMYSDNLVRLILSDIDLEEEPRFLLPDVQLSLASNVLKIQTTLSKMIIHANYTLIRNESDIIYEPKYQNTAKTSPFLFKQVQEVGRLAIRMETCKLSGFIMATLYGESVNLAYNHFKFYNCEYVLEIYKPGEDSPPVIAPYELDRKHGLGLNHLLMKPLLTEELVPKLQAAMFSYVNTSAIFGRTLEEYRQNQETVFQITEEFLTVLIRELNKITLEMNDGAIDMDDYAVRWDDGTIKPSKYHPGGETMTLFDMQLTGLNTMYSAHCGGPYKIENVLIADEIRFSSLQVQGKLKIDAKMLNTFSFAVEISDMAVNFQMDGKDGGNSKKSKRQTEIDNSGFLRLEVTGLRRMVFIVPTLIFRPAESLISGYLSYEVPKLLKSHLSHIFFEAITKVSMIPVDINRNLAYSEGIPDDYNSAETNPKSESKPLTDSEDVNYQDLKGQRRDRDIFKKNKKRFKSANRPRRLRRYRSRKRVVDNQIRKQ